ITAPSAALLSLLTENQLPLPHKAKEIATPKTMSNDAVSINLDGLSDTAKKLRSKNMGSASRIFLFMV
ncbi:MAG: hypothetical protein VW842_09165, partial [Halieaceae bacterium]